MLNDGTLATTELAWNKEMDGNPFKKLKFFSRQTQKSKSHQLKLPVIQHRSGDAEVRAATRSPSGPSKLPIQNHHQPHQTICGNLYWLLCFVVSLSDSLGFSMLIKHNRWKNLAVEEKRLLHQKKQKHAVLLDFWPDWLVEVCTFSISCKLVQCALDPPESPFQSRPLLSDIRSVVW